MPVVIINSPTDVTIDGVSSGAVGDSIANHPSLAGDIQRALAAWDAAKTAAAATAQTAAVIDAVAAQQTAGATAQTAAVAAAVDPLEKQITTLTGQVAALQAQLAGTVDAPTISLTAIQKVAISMAAAEAGVSFEAVLNEFVQNALDDYALSKQNEIFALAMANYPTIPDADQQTVNDILSLSFLNAATTEQRVIALAGIKGPDGALQGGLALPAFMALDAERRGKLLTVLRMA